MAIERSKTFLSTRFFCWKRKRKKRFLQAIDHQDVHELNRLLFDAIQKSLQGTKQSNLIRSCYEGSTINYTQCKNCQKIFKRAVNLIEFSFLNSISMSFVGIFQEDYHDLPLVVQDSPNLHTSLANIFTIPESLVGDNRYRCSACANQLCDAEKVTKISTLKKKKQNIDKLFVSFSVGKNR